MLDDFSDILRFGFLIHDVSRVRRTVADRMLKPLGVTRSQWWLMAYLSRRDGMTQTALARDLDLSRVAIGELVSRLEDSGLIERRDDANDGRTRRVFPVSYTHLDVYKRQKMLRSSRQFSRP